jgi:FAD/FMN-containing dehydrogenase
MSVQDGVERIPGFAGEVIRRDDPGYDEARAIWNAMHDKRPALVARCASSEDVVAALRFGRDHGLPIAVRAGGHSMPGHSVCDDGIVIDLRPLNAVTVDPATRRATVQGGALLGDVDRATQAHGLVVPAGVVSHTGVGGLTLGGGVGRLMRRFGLTIDSLVYAEVVTADGRILRASATENPDLFWGIRGGGGNFGIVTEFEFALHELSELLLLATFHRGEDGRSVLDRGRRAMAAGAPDALLWTSFLRKAPTLPWIPPELVGEPGVMSLIEWSGELAEGKPLLTEIQAELAPLASSLDVVPFLEIQTLTDEIFGPGKRTYIKAGFVNDLSDAVIDALCAQGAEVGSPLSQIEVLAMGGAINRVPVDATAFPNRDVAWLINVPAMWEAVEDTEAEIAWARRTYKALEPHMTDGKYINFMGEDEGGDSTGAYAGTFERLRSVKRTYDPGNVFRLNQNISPNVD